MPVTVLIVNWNSDQCLERCLDCLARQSYKIDRILVVDNGSTDGSADVAERYEDVSVIRMRDNLGFAAANNLGVKECNTEFVVLLNPDAFPDRDWLQHLVEAASAHPQFAAFGSCQLQADAPNILDGVGDIYHFSGQVRRSGYGSKLRQKDLIEREIFSPCAAAALYRREAFVEAGGFDEDFFCYVEDVDLGFRLRLLGYRAQYVPNAVVYHVGSAASGGRKSDFAVYYGHRNLVWAFVKNMPGILFWLFLPLHLVLNAVTIMWFCGQGRARLILRAKWDAIQGVPKMWAKRSKIQQQRVATVMDIWRVLNKRLMP